MRSKLIVSAFFTLPVLAVAGEAPFCVVAGWGTQCHYYDANLCRQAAASSRGMCVANQATQSQRPAIPTIQPADIVGNFQRGYSFGAQMRQQQEAHAAEIRAREAEAALYEAQRQQAAASTQYQQAATQQTGPKVSYICENKDGYRFASDMPFVGCVVVSVDY